MIKHVVAGLSIILAVWAMLYMYKLDKEVDKLEKIYKIIEKSKMQVSNSEKTTQKYSEKKKVETKINNTKDEDEMAQKLKALRDKAGNIAAFKVSTLYKKNCSSCHGPIGEGIIGPKLIGQSEEKILQSLKDFKSGKKKNYVMYGLLGNLNDKQMEDLSKEIASFQSKLDAADIK